MTTPTLGDIYRIVSEIGQPVEARRELETLYSEHMATDVGFCQWVAACQHDYDMKHGVQRKGITAREYCVNWGCDPNAINQVFGAAQ